MGETNEDPRYDAEVEAARAAQQRPDSAAADREQPDREQSGEDADLEPQAAAAAVDKGDTPGMDAAHRANADGANPGAG